jgi:chitin disaccharide deacetylase
MTKSIVLCADDYGQAPAISDGILALLLKQRLSAVSCLVNTPFWHQAAAALFESSSRADIGLHFNLTEGEALSPAYKAAYGAHFSSLGVLMRRSLFRQLDQQVIVQECEAQLDAFQAAMGFLPRFIDGHQHVHQFPVVRDAFLSVYERRLRAQGSYVRLAKPALHLFKHYKRLIIALSGANVFQKQLDRLEIPHNSSFSGNYSFGDTGRYRAHFQTFLDEVGHGGMIMCHPALRDEQSSDSIAKARFEEYLYLASDQFLEDCAQKEVKIRRFLVEEPA